MPGAARGGAHSKQLVYVSTQYDSVGAVNIYSVKGQGQQPIGTITTGISLPAGLAVDAAGTLYVANSGNNTVTVYPPGQSTPSVTYSEGIGTPLSVAVGHDGTLYVANETGSPSGTGTITEYPPGSTTPSVTIALGYAFATAVALDSSNNLYGAWFTFGSYGIAVYKYPSEGSAGGSNLNLDLPSYVYPAFAMAFDNGGNLVVPCESLTHGPPKYLAVFPPGATKPKRKINEGGLLDVVSGLAFPSGNSKLLYITAENDHDWMALTYPKAVPRDVVNVSIPTGIALSP